MKLKLIGLMAVMLIFSLGCFGCDWLFDDGIDYEVTANGTIGSVTTTALTLTFKEDISGLVAGDITITNGTGEAAKGSLSGSGKSYTLNVNVAKAGSISVKIDKEGIKSTAKTETVHFYTPGGNGNGNGGGKEPGGGGAGYFQISGTIIGNARGYTNLDVTVYYGNVYTTIGYDMGIDIATDNTWYVGNSDYIFAIPGATIYALVDTYCTVEKRPVYLGYFTLRICDGQYQFNAVINLDSPDG